MSERCFRDKLIPPSFVTWFVHVFEWLYVVLLLSLHHCIFTFTAPDGFFEVFSHHTIKKKQFKWAQISLETSSNNPPQSSRLQLTLTHSQVSILLFLCSWIWPLYKNCVKRYTKIRFRFQLFYITALSKRHAHAMCTVGAVGWLCPEMFKQRKMSMWNMEEIVGSVT